MAVVFQTQNFCEEEREINTAAGTENLMAGPFLKGK